ncbi:MAG: tetratricopeptide repeat protein [candidate division WOR-3 bacterium]
MLVLISLLFIISQSPDQLSKEMELDYLILNKKYPEALELAKELYSQTGDLTFLKKITLLEFLNGNEERGIESGLKYLENVVDSAIFFLLANVLKVKGNLLLLDKVLDKHKDNDTVDLYRGYLYYEIGDFDKAYSFMSRRKELILEKVFFAPAYLYILMELNKEEELSDFVELVPEPTLELTYAKALFLWCVGKNQEALERFNKVFEEYEYRDLYFLQAYMTFLEEIGDFPKSDSLAELLISLSPLNGEVRKAVGIHYYNVGNFMASFTSLLIAGSLLEGDGEIHYYLARLLVASRSFHDALSEIDKALKLDPYSKDYRYYRIYILLNMDSVGLAMREVYNLQAQGIKEGYFYYLKAQCLDKMGDFKGAHENFKVALLKDSTNLKRYRDFLLHAKEKKIDIDFEFYLRKVLGVCESASDSIDVSSLALELGKYDIAIEILEGFASKDSITPEVLNNLAYALCEANRDLEKALGFIDKALELEPYKYEYIDTKAWILYKLGRIEEARYYIQMAIELGGEKKEEIRYHWEVINGKKWDK